MNLKMTFLLCLTILCVSTLNAGERQKKPCVTQNSANKLDKYIKTGITITANVGIGIMTTAFAAVCSWALYGKIIGHQQDSALSAIRDLNKFVHLRHDQVISMFGRFVNSGSYSEKIMAIVRQGRNHAGFYTLPPDMPAATAMFSFKYYKKQELCSFKDLFDQSGLV